MILPRELEEDKIKMLLEMNTNGETKKGIGKRDAKKQSRWRKLDMTAEDKSGTRNERELREKVAGRKLGSTEVKEHV